MGRFVNAKTSAFQDTLNSEIYIDKTGLLEYTNHVMDTIAKFIRSKNVLYETLQSSSNSCSSRRNL